MVDLEIEKVKKAIIDFAKQVKMDRIGKGNNTRKKEIMGGREIEVAG